MAIIHIKFEDSEEGVKVNIVSDTVLPIDIEHWTGAQLLARQTSTAIDALMDEYSEKTNEVQTG